MALAQAAPSLPPLPSQALLAGLLPSSPHAASACLAFCSPPCQLFNLSRRLMNQNERLQTTHSNKAQVQSRGD